jgi:ureidoglycolate lyase
MVIEARRRFTPKARGPLALRPITGAAFAPFGHVVAPGRNGMSVNDATALRHDIHYFDGAAADPALSLVTAVFEVKGQSLPQAIRKLERCPRSAQLIAPISIDEHVIIVAAAGPDGMPDLDSLTAFRLGGRQGVVYRKGLWHHPTLALGRDGLFLVQSWQDGSRLDCETFEFEQILLG